MDPERILRFSEPEIGLEATLVIDNTVLGPAAGGIRTKHYENINAAEVDAMALAHAMTVKCALAGLDAGGGKAVIVEQADWDRAAVFRRFGEIVQELGGQFRTAGDLGTRVRDLKHMAEHCQYVHCNERSLAGSVARGLVASMRALAASRGRDLSDLRIAVQGCGAIGAAVATALAREGPTLLVSDLNRERAEGVASSCGAQVTSADELLEAKVDVVSPCAAGGVITRDVVRSLRAWGICGAANNIVADQAAHDEIEARGLALVPDSIASAGAVIEGIGDTVMGLRREQRTALIDGLGATASEVLRRAIREGVDTQQIAVKLARDRIAAR